MASRPLDPSSIARQQPQCHESLTFVIFIYYPNGIAAICLFPVFFRMNFSDSLSIIRTTFSRVYVAAPGVLTFRFLDSG